MTSLRDLLNGVSDLSTDEEEDGENKTDNVRANSIRNEMSVADEVFTDPKTLGIEIVKHGSILKSVHGSYFMHSKQLSGPNSRFYVCRYSEKFGCPVKIEERVRDGLCRTKFNHTCPMKSMKIMYVDPELDPKLDSPCRIDFRQRSDLPVLKSSSEDIEVFVSPERTPAEVMELKYYLTWNFFFYYTILIVPHRFTAKSTQQPNESGLYPIEVLVHGQFVDKVESPPIIPVTQPVVDTSFWEISRICIFDIYPSRGPCSGGHCVEIYFSLSSPEGMNLLPLCFLDGHEVQSFNISPFLQIQSILPVDPKKRKTLINQASEGGVSRFHGTPQYVLVCTTKKHGEGYVDIEISTNPSQSTGGILKKGYFFEKDNVFSTRRSSSSFHHHRRFSSQIDTDSGVNEIGMTAFHYYAAKGNIEELKRLLLEEDAPTADECLLKMDYFSNTALHYAYMYQRRKVIKLIKIVLVSGAGSADLKKNVDFDKVKNYKGLTARKLYKKEKTIRNVYKSIRMGVWSRHLFEFMEKRDIVNVTICCRIFYLFFHLGVHGDEPSPAEAIPALICPLPNSDPSLSRIQREDNYFNAFEFESSLRSSTNQMTFDTSFECCRTLVRMVYLGPERDFEWNEDDKNPYLLTMGYSSHLKQFQATCSRMIIMNKKNKIRSSNTNSSLVTFEFPSVIWKISIDRDTEFLWRRSKKTVRILYFAAEEEEEEQQQQQIRTRKKMLAEFFFYNYVELRRFVGYIKVIIATIKKYCSHDDMIPVHLFSQNNLESVKRRKIVEQDEESIENVSKCYPLTFHQRIPNNNNKRKEYRLIYGRMNVLDPKISAKASLEYLKYIFIMVRKKKQKTVFHLQSLHEIIHQQQQQPSSSHYLLDAEKIRKYFSVPIITKEKKQQQQVDGYDDENKTTRTTTTRTRTLKSLKEDFKKKYFDDDWTTKKHYYHHHPFGDLMKNEESSERILDELRVLQYQNFQVSFQQKKRTSQILKKLFDIHNNNNNNIDNNKFNKKKKKKKKSFFSDVNFLASYKYLWNQQESLFRLLFLLLLSPEDEDVKYLSNKEEEEYNNNKYEATSDYYFDHLFLEEVKRRMKDQHPELKWKNVSDKEMNYRKFYRLLQELNVDIQQQVNCHHNSQQQQQDEEDNMIRHEHLCFEIFRHFKIRDLRIKLFCVLERLKQIRFLGLQGKGDDGSHPIPMNIINNPEKQQTNKSNDDDDDDRPIPMNPPPSIFKRKKNGGRRSIFSSLFSPSSDFEDYAMNLPEDPYYESLKKREEEIIKNESKEEEHEEGIRIFSKEQLSNRRTKKVMRKNEEEKMRSEFRLLGNSVNPLDQRLLSYKEKQQQQQQKKKNKEQQKRILCLQQKAARLGSNYAKYLKTKLQKWISRDERATRLLYMKFMCSEKRIQEMEKFLRLRFQRFLKKNKGIGLHAKILANIADESWDWRDRSVVVDWNKKERMKKKLRKDEMSSDEEEEFDDDDDDDEEEEEEEDMNNTKKRRNFRMKLILMNRISMEWTEEGIVRIEPAGTQSSDSLPVCIVDCEAPILCAWEEVIRKLNELTLRIFEWNSSFTFRSHRDGRQLFRSSLAMFGIGPVGKGKGKKNFNRHQGQKGSTVEQFKTQSDFCEDILQVFNFCGMYQQSYDYLHRCALLVSQHSDKSFLKDHETTMKRIMFFDVDQKFFEEFSEVFLSVLHLEEYQKRVYFQTHSQLDTFVFECVEIVPQFDSIYPGVWNLLKGFDRALWVRFWKFCCLKKDNVKNEEILILESEESEEEEEFCRNKEEMEMLYRRSKRGCPFNMKFREGKDYLVVSKELRIPNNPPSLGRVKMVYPDDRRMTRKMLMNTSFF